MGATAAFEKFHEKHQPAIDEHLDAFFTELQEQETEYRKAATIERFSEFVLRGGKRLRPLSVLLGHGAVTGEDPDDPLYRLSLPVEIYHNGTLIQDDFMDQDGTRRGGPAYHRLVLDRYREILPTPSIPSQAVKRVNGFLRPGLESADRREMAAGSQAITGGNQLDNFADWPIYEADLDAETQTELLRILNETGISVNFGQDLDLEMEQLTLRDVARERGVLSPSLREQVRTGVHDAAAWAQGRVDHPGVEDGLSRVMDRTDTDNDLYNHILNEHGTLVDAYINMIDEKTVDLYVASIDIGAVVGGATQRQRDYLRDAMRDIGRAFQIQDDYLEIEESVEQTGKEPTDVINGKLTLASISTYESLNTVVDVLEGAADRFDTER
ncbi:MAG: polyprenyl synthetase family protein, partial [Candidatus Nanohaloarchaea archaeon]|nr:polyprenyl synthetase family protein [Candidatus Nanohaloarchaea archaeon]